MAQLTLSDYKNNLFSNHFLEERIQELNEWQEVDFEEKFDELKEIYDKNKDFLTEQLNEDQTQQRFIDPILKKLGHDWTPEARRKVGSRTDGKTLNPDYAFLGFEKQLDVNDDEEKDYFDESYAIGDAKAWNRTLDKSSQDHTNPAFQIYNYVDRLRADWGLLTNGKKWRLYSYEDCAADIYFEVDLESILAGEKTDEKVELFKYFYLFFRAESFEEGFLEEVYKESVEYNEGLEDDLEDKVYDALEVAVEGFFDTNDIEKTEENIDLVHHSSLIFLYRILFILNAESRDLLPTDDEAYRQAFGLTQLKRMIIDDEEDSALFQDTTVAWDNRLSRLFEGIDDGYDLHETEIPAYNGGLFDEENGEENQFLAENKLYGSYIKEILELLATNYDEEKGQRVILDYKDLNIRHLGSVYEGLLEHKFKAAEERKVLKNEEWQDFSEQNKEWEDFDEEKRVEEGELYLTNESGERKATGSYYTPEYIVEYIVENTVGPKVEEKIEEAEENGGNILPKVLELNVCDPAMGSGHFLTEATQYIAENIVQHADLEEQEIDENEDELNWAKRQVVQNCIYGVDINPLAVELGKLSLWIETMAEGKPLNFLDHHLKHGNSLIGSDFDEIFSHPTEDQKRLDSERYQFGDPQEIKESFQEQYLEIEEMPENTVEQIHEKEQAYKQFISNNILYQQFNQLSNIHTRQFFESEANSSDYESFLINVGNESNPFENTEWYKNAQQDAEHRNYFHWQLEFPKVFFGDQNGFDAVVGNPPYVKTHNLPEFYREYSEKVFDIVSNTDQPDIYQAFLEKSHNISSKSNFSFIVPTLFYNGDQYTYFREKLLDYGISKIVDCGDGVFEGVGMPTGIIEFDQGSDSFEVHISSSNNFEFRKTTSYEFIKQNPSAQFAVFSETKAENVIQKLNEIDSKIEDNFDWLRGLEIGKSSDLLSNKETEQHDEKIVTGEDVERYSVKSTKWLNSDKADLKKERFFKDDKILIRETGSRITSLVENEGLYTTRSLYNFIKSGYDSSLENAVAQLNSSLFQFYYKSLFKTRTQLFPKIRINQATTLPILEEECGIEDEIKDLAEGKREHNSINLNIQDYLGNYSDGKTLGDLYTPAEGLSEEIVSDTSADRDSLRIGSVEFEERNGELILKVSARYKPEDSENIDEDELDRWGYFETEKVPGMKFNVDDKMRPLIEEFVSLAVDEAGGFAGFRESATKTNSVIDRLEKLTLPKLEDVEQGLEKFIENREEAEKLEEEIQETDELIDAIVFDLYDLTEEEVETVLDSLDTGESEKASILEKFDEV